MQQERDQQHEPTQSGYITLRAVEQEIGITRVTLKKYLDKLGITPINWHIGDRSLYISQDEKERVKKLKQEPALLEQLRSPARWPSS